MKKLIPLFAIAAGLVLAGCNQNASNPPSENTTGGMTTNSSPPTGMADTNGAAK